MMLARFEIVIRHISEGTVEAIPEYTLGSISYDVRKPPSVAAKELAVGLRELASALERLTDVSI